MHIYTQTPLGTPQWNEGRERRLAVCLVAATLLVAAVLSIVRLPIIPDLSPIFELVVRIVDPERVEETVAETPPVEIPPPAEIVEKILEPIEPAELTPPTQIAEDVAEPAEISPPMQLADDVAEADSQQLVKDLAAPTENARSEAPGVEATNPPIDWEAARTEAVEAYLDELENSPSPNPVLAEKRRRLAGQYQPRTTSAPKPIWENAEKDQLGRTVLRSGGCYKVLDDPNVGSRLEFEQFGQYIPKCTYQRRLPKELPWVEEIRQRYHYLRDPDGYLEGVDGPGDVRPEDLQE